MNAPLSAVLLNDPRIWRGASQLASTLSTESSGHPALDSALPGFGWPMGAISELVTQRAGCGELRILLPVIARLTQTGQSVVLINPPHIPYAPAWAAAGVDMQHVTWVSTENQKDTLWAIEQALREPGCGAVVGWVNGSLADRAARRLNLSAEQGGTCGFLLREGEASQIVSPFALRLSVQPGHGGVWLQILKRRGTPLAQPLFIGSDRPQQSRLNQTAHTTNLQVSKTHARNTARQGMPGNRPAPSVIVPVPLNHSTPMATSSTTSETGKIHHAVAGTLPAEAAHRVRARLALAIAA